MKTKDMNILDPDKFEANPLLIAGSHKAINQYSTALMIKGTSGRETFIATAKMAGSAEHDQFVEDAKVSLRSDPFAESGFSAQSNYVMAAFHLGLQGFRLSGHNRTFTRLQYERLSDHGHLRSKDSGIRLPYAEP